MKNGSRSGASAWLLIILTVIATGFSGCRQETEPVTDKQQARVLLNENRYALARDLLIRLHSENPDDDEVVLLLASSHAGLAGLNIVESWRMFEPLVFQEKAANQALLTAADESVPDTSDGEVLTRDPGQFERETFKFLSTLARDFNLLGRMPRFNLSGRSEINEALRLIASLKPEQDSYFRGKLYGVFLNLFQFSGMVRDSFPEVPANQPYDFETIICQFNPSLFIDNIDLGLRYLSNAVADLKSAGTVKELRGEIKFEQLEKSLRSLSEIKARGDAGIAGILGGQSAITQSICK